MAAQETRLLPTEAELRKQKLLAWLSDPKPAWKDEDHPDLAAMGTFAWVQKMREPDEAKMAKIMQRVQITPIPGLKLHQ